MKEETTGYILSGLLILFYVLVFVAIRWAWLSGTYWLKKTTYQTVSCESYYNEQVRTKENRIEILEAKLEVYEDKWQKINLEK